MDADAVTRLLGRPRVLGLGEPTHGSTALLTLRNELFRQLVEEAGYRTIALESDCMMGLIADEYVASGTGGLDEVMERGFSHHELGAGPGNRELVRWMRSYNDGRPAAEQVHLIGFDGPLEMSHAASPRQALTALHSYLGEWVDAGPAAVLDELLGDDDAWTNHDAMMVPSASIGRSPEAQQLRLLADELTSVLDTQTPYLIAATSRDAWDRARLYARTATGLLRYHACMAAPVPDRWARLSGLRDAMMAANVIAAAERSPVLVHAHNSHLQRPISTMRMGDQQLEWWSAGAQVSARLGSSYAVIATAVGTIRAHDVGVPPVDTIEGHLDSLPAQLHDPRQLPTGFAPRRSPWFGYAPLDPAQLPTYDGVIYLKEA
ncbi:erythromycin esterase family protein [Kribbella sp. NPDC026611]|uniref:erythromycin esterase family protein n=1 Tax=Kribbella sp. NPDC026611 TaxID=3154911 RepID=UPI0034054072